MIDEGLMCASLEMAAGLPEVQPVKAGDQPGMEAPVCFLDAGVELGIWQVTQRQGSFPVSPLSLLRVVDHGYL